VVVLKQVAKMLDTEHHEFHFTVQEGIDAVQVMNTLRSDCLIPPGDVIAC